MDDAFKISMQRVFKFLIVLSPMVLVMYFLYALGKYEVWTPETAHRDKITIFVVFLGMVSSFLVYSYFLKRTISRR